MLNLLKALRQDEHGVILSAELVIIGSLLVIGLISGLTCLQKSVNGELRDLAGAIGALDQTYSFSSHRKSGYGDQCCAYTAGSSFVNCEQQSDKCGDIVGGACTVQTEGCSTNNCGQCGTCTNSIGRPEGRSACGSCGGREGGCSTCGGSRYLNKTGARCIDTGVPNMKVTEWPRSNDSAEIFHAVPNSSECPVAPTHEGHFHNGDVIIEQSVPRIEFPAPAGQAVPAIEERVVPHQDAPVLPPTPSPANQPSLVPVPEVQPIPVNPMPPMARGGRLTPVVSMR